MQLIEFMKNNENWEELLSKDPYNLIINKQNGYVLLKYNQIKSDFSLDIVKEARGIIIREKDFKIMCFPFTKFFNVDEPYADKIDWDNIRVQEKVDGSLIKLWCDKKDGVDKWHVSTNGCIDAFQAPIDTDLCPYKSFGELFMSAFNPRIFQNMNKNHTYMFELVSPYNKIVVSYPFTRIYHLGTRDNITGKELEEDIGIIKPKVYDLKTRENIKLAASKLPFDEEGYVVVDKNYRRVKIKSPAYVNAHRLINNKVINTEKVLDLIIQNEQDEFLSYFPEYKTIFKETENRYNKFKRKLKSIELRINKAKEHYKDRKKFALRVKKYMSDYQTMAFLMYDNKISGYKEYLESLATKKIIEGIEKNERI